MNAASTVGGESTDRGGADPVVVAVSEPCNGVGGGLGGEGDALRRARQMASVRRSAVRGERLAMRVRTAERSAVGVPQREGVACAAAGGQLVAEGPLQRGRHRQQGVSEPVGGPGGVGGEVRAVPVMEVGPHGVSSSQAGSKVTAGCVGQEPGVVGESAAVDVSL